MPQAGYSPISIIAHSCPAIIFLSSASIEISHPLMKLMSFPWKITSVSREDHLSMSEVPVAVILAKPAAEEIQIYVNMVRGQKD
jgi:hypothetical protein